MAEALDRRATELLREQPGTDVLHLMELAGVLAAEGWSRREALGALARAAEDGRRPRHHEDLRTATEFRSTPALESEQVDLGPVALEVELAVGPEVRMLSWADLVPEQRVDQLRSACATTSPEAAAAIALAFAQHGRHLGLPLAAIEVAVRATEAAAHDLLACPALHHQADEAAAAAIAEVDGLPSDVLRRSADLRALVRSWPARVATHAPALAAELQALADRLPVGVDEPEADPELERMLDEEAMDQVLVSRSGRRSRVWRSAPTLGAEVLDDRPTRVHVAVVGALAETSLFATTTEAEVTAHQGRPALRISLRSEVASRLEPLVRSRELVQADGGDFGARLAAELDWWRLRAVATLALDEPPEIGPEPADATRRLLPPMVAVVASTDVPADDHRSAAVHVDDGGRTLLVRLAEQPTERDVVALALRSDPLVDLVGAAVAAERLRQLNRWTQAAQGYEALARLVAPPEDRTDDVGIAEFVLAATRAAECLRRAAGQSTGAEATELRERADALVTRAQGLDPLLTEVLLEDAAATPSEAAAALFQLRDELTGELERLLSRAPAADLDDVREVGAQLVAVDRALGGGSSQH
jgi:hypothetical protein